MALAIRLDLCAAALGVSVAGALLGCTAPASDARAAALSSGPLERASAASPTPSVVPPPAPVSAPTADAIAAPPSATAASSAPAASPSPPSASSSGPAASPSASASAEEPCHCFDWVHQDDFGRSCHPTRAICDAERARGFPPGRGDTTPCKPAMCAVRR